MKNGTSLGYHWNRQGVFCWWYKLHPNWWYKLYPTITSCDAAIIGLWMLLIGYKGGQWYDILPWSSISIPFRKHLVEAPRWTAVSTSNSKLLLLFKQDVQHISNIIIYIYIYISHRSFASPASPSQPHPHPPAWWWPPDQRSTARPTSSRRSTPRSGAGNRSPPPPPTAAGDAGRWRKGEAFGQGKVWMDSVWTWGELDIWMMMGR